MKTAIPNVVEQMLNRRYARAAQDAPIIKVMNLKLILLPIMRFGIMHPNSNSNLRCLILSVVEQMLNRRLAMAAQDALSKKVMNLKLILPPIMRFGITHPNSNLRCLILSVVEQML